MVEKEMVRRELMGQVQDNTIIEDALLNSEGKEIGSRLRAHPGLNHLKWIDEQLGLTADAMRLSRKSQGEGAGDGAIAIAARLAHDEALRLADKSRLPEADETLFATDKK